MVMLMMVQQVYMYKMVIYIDDEIDVVGHLPMHWHEIGYLEMLLMGLVEEVVDENREDEEEDKVKQTDDFDDDDDDSNKSMP